MAILNIETATSICSVALSEKGKVIFEKTSFDGPSHAALLGIFVDEVVKKAKSSNIKIEAVAVSSGPGSYTGLRIGVSMAKGLCFGWNIPLISISTLEILASKAIKAYSDSTPNALFCPMIDARRMEVYNAVYDEHLQKISEIKADVVTPEIYSSLLEKQKIYFFGNGSAKCKNVIQSPNAVFLNDINALAANMAELSEKAFKEQRFENVAYFEPFYLKEFVATIPKNKVLGEIDKDK